MTLATSVDLCDITDAAEHLSNRSFRLWAWAITQTDKPPEYWCTDIFRRDLRYSPSMITRTIDELIHCGYLDLELKAVPGRRGRLSLWTFFPRPRPTEATD